MGSKSSSSGDSSDATLDTSSRDVFSSRFYGVMGSQLVPVLGGFSLAESERGRSVIRVYTPNGDRD